MIDPEPEPEPPSVGTPKPARASRSKLSPTARTLRALRAEGIVCEVVERFNAYAGPFGIRQDAFGVIDVLALAPGHIVGIQCCARSGHSAHRNPLNRAAGLTTFQVPTPLLTGVCLYVLGAFHAVRVPKGPGHPVRGVGQRKERPIAFWERE